MSTSTPDTATGKSFATPTDARELSLLNHNRSEQHHGGRPQRRPHPPRPVLVAAVLLLLAVAIGTAYWWTRAAAGPAALVASGTVEVDEVTLSAESAGRLVNLSVDEGSRVTEGQLVGQLDDPVLDVQRKQSVADAAQQQLTQAQLSHLELRAPISGVVQKQIAHRGEYVAPGAPVLTVADPSDLKLTLYVVESDLGQVAPGQQVTLRSDAYPDRVFTGQVRTVADKAEFTPRNVQTQKDRQNLVFAVTVRVPNPDLALKAGLPVDATFGRLP
jgi:HlyD family secretion protein